MTISHARDGNSKAEILCAMLLQEAAMLKQLRSLIQDRFNRALKFGPFMFASSLVQDGFKLRCIYEARLLVARRTWASWSSASEKVISMNLEVSALVLGCTMQTSQTMSITSLNFQSWSFFFVTDGERVNKPQPWAKKKKSLSLNLTSLMQGTLVSATQYIHVRGHFRHSITMHTPKNLIISSGVAFAESTPILSCTTLRLM